MKPEPLKGKSEATMNYVSCYPKQSDLYHRKRIRSAVEWLKENITYQEYQMDLAIDINNKINEAFKDVLISSRLEDVKQGKVLSTKELKERLEGGAE